MNITDTLSNLAAIGQQVADLQRQAKEARKAALEPFLDELARSGQVSIITVRGSTPSFNDGEPCEHGADFWVNIDQHWGDEVDMTEELEEIFGELEATGGYVDRKWTEYPEAKDHNVRFCKTKGHVYDKPSDEIIHAIQAVIFDSIEEDFGTNYYVSFVLKDGKFVRTEGDYDCGY